MKIVQRLASRIIDPAGDSRGQFLPSFCDFWSVEPFHLILKYLDHIYIGNLLDALKAEDIADNRDHAVIDMDDILFFLDPFNLGEELLDLLEEFLNQRGFARSACPV